MPEKQRSKNILPLKQRERIRRKGERTKEVNF
jgi:hypothetical protein